MKKYISLSIGFLLTITILAFPVYAHKHHEDNDWNHCYKTINDDCNYLSPTLTPIPTVDPCIEQEVIKYGDDEVVCPTPTEKVTPTITPSAEPTVEPTAPPAGHGDGLSDGRSSCPECTQAPKTQPQPSLAPCTPTTCGWK